MIGPAELTLAASGAGLGEATFYLASLDGRGRIALDDGRPIYPASMIKTPLAVATGVAVGAGRLRYGDRIAISPGNMTPNDGPSPLRPGYAATVAELVELMITQSDNVATNVLYDVLDRARATADIVALGYRETAFRRKLSGALPLIDDPLADGRNSHPAREAADLFEQIAFDRVPSAGIIRNLLAEQAWNTKLSAGLEPRDRFAHKTGDTDEVSHDGGILTTADGARYVIVVATEMPSNEANDAKFAAFMRAIRPALSRE